MVPWVRAFWLVPILYPLDLWSLGGKVYLPPTPLHQVGASTLNIFADYPEQKCSKPFKKKIVFELQLPLPLPNTTTITTTITKYHKFWYLVVVVVVVCLNTTTTTTTKYQHCDGPSLGARSWDQGLGSWVGSAGPRRVCNPPPWL